MTQFAILIFDKLTALDAVGPYEVLSRVPGHELVFVWPGGRAAPYRHRPAGPPRRRGARGRPEPDVLLIPGGEGNRPLLKDDRVLDWVRDVHEHTTWTTSVCTGSLVLGAAGLLEGKRATTHWAYHDTLEEYGATAVAERFVEDGKVMTAAGVSAGIDMSLALVARMFHENVAKAIQLGIEYDPDPPFDSGSPEKAAPELVELVRGMERSQT